MPKKMTKKATKKTAKKAMTEAQLDMMRKQIEDLAVTGVNATFKFVGQILQAKTDGKIDAGDVFTLTFTAGALFKPIIDKVDALIKSSKDIQDFAANIGNFEISVNVSPKG